MKYYRLSVAHLQANDRDSKGLHKLECGANRSGPFSETGMLRRSVWLITIALFICFVVATGVTSADETEHTRSAPPDVATRIERGLNYLYGVGVERDHVNALKWFILARNDQYYRLLAAHMTELQKSLASASADICEESEFADCD